MDFDFGVGAKPQSLIKILLLREIQEAFASRRFWAILALCLILIPLGVEVSIRDYQTRLQGYREAVRIYQEETKTISDVLYKEGAKAFFPPSPLSFLSLGLELVIPNVAESQFVSANPPAVMRLNNNQGIDNLYEFFFGPLDVVFIVGVIMSFLAIILTFGAIAGEKEQGTLKQVLSNSVPRAQVLLAKAAANGVVLIIPFLLALILTLSVLKVQGIVLSVAGVSTSIGMAILMSVLLIGAFFNLGLLVSSLTKQAVPALVILLLAWVFLYGVFPRLSSAVAEIIVPVKSEGQVDFEKAQVKRDVYKERDAEIDRVIRQGDKNLTSQPGELGKTQEEVQNRYQAKLEGSWTILDRDIKERQNKQFALATALSRLSPVSCFVRPMSELSRSGWLEYEQFDGTVRHYGEVLNREIFSKQKWLRTSGGVTGWNEANIKAPAPVFAYPWVPIDAVISNVLPDILMLVLFNLVFFAGAFVAFLSYDPR